MTAQLPDAGPRFNAARSPRQPTGRFVGRVGALAVALGIGVALANTPGVALADESQPSNSSRSSAKSDAGTSARSRIENKSDKSAETKSKKTKNSLKNARKDASDKAKSGPKRSSDSTAPAAGKVDKDDAVTDTTTAPDPAGTRDDDRTSSPRRSRQQFRAPSSESVRTRMTDTAKRTEPSPPTTVGGTETHTSAVSTTDPVPASLTSAVVVAPTSTAVTAPTPDADDTPDAPLITRALSTVGLAPQATGNPVAPTSSPALWAMLGFARREIGHTAALRTATAVATTTSQQNANTQPSIDTTVSPLGTPQQLNAEQIASRTVNTLPVCVMKFFLRLGFLNAANKQLPNGPDSENLAALNNAVNEYALAAAFQQLLINPMTPTVVTQVAPPHIWYGQDVGGTRILYDNPDTIYRFMAVSASSEYVITGRFLDLSDEGLPADTSFSVLEGLAGTTSSLLTFDDLVVNDDGTFVITVSAEPANGRPNHLQLTSGSTIIAARNTLGDWNTEVPMSLSIQRVSGPPNSLAAQLGLFTFLGPVLNDNPWLTKLVSLVPPLPYVPPILRGAFTAIILLVRGVNEQAKYMGLATTDPDSGQPRAANELSQPSSNAEFLANQRQSSGVFELEDDQALVVTIDPGDAGYFIVPIYNVWTITDNYWDQPTSLNNEQAIPNAPNAEGKVTYTVVISPTDPGVQNWISTGGLNQGLISMRFQNVGGDPNNAPRIVSQTVMSHAEAQAALPAVTQEELDMRAARKTGFDRRWAPYPQP